MIVSTKIAEMFKHCGFVNIDYLVKNKLERNPSKILNILNRDWRKWVKPVCMKPNPRILDPNDPNFGNETAGSSKRDCLLDSVHGTVFTSPSDVDKAVSLTFSCKKDTGTAYAKGVIVLHSNLNIITNGRGQPVQFTTTQAWRTSSFSTQPTLSPNTAYVLMAIASASYFQFYWTDHTSTDLSHHDNSNSYSSPTNPTDATHDDYMFSIYCAYTTGGVLKEVTDSLSLSDAVSVNKTLIVTDSLSMADSVLRDKPLVEILDSLSFSDVVLVNKTITVQDVLSIADQVSVDYGFTLKEVLDTLTLQDLIKVNKTLQISDTLTLQDFIQKVGEILLNKTKLDKAKLDKTKRDK